MEYSKGLFLYIDLVSYSDVIGSKKDQE